MLQKLKSYALMPVPQHKLCEARAERNTGRVRASHSPGPSRRAFHAGARAQRLVFNGAKLLTKFGACGGAGRPVHEK